MSPPYCFACLRHKRSGLVTRGEGEAWQGREGAKSGRPCSPLAGCCSATSRQGEPSTKVRKGYRGGYAPARPWGDVAALHRDRRNPLRRLGGWGGRRRREEGGGGERETSTIKAELRIRIHWIQTRIRIRIQHFKWIQSGSKVLMTRNWRKKIAAEHFLKSFFD